MGKIKATSLAKKFLKSETAVLLTFVIICISLSFVSPNFLTRSNVINILQQSVIVGLASLGMTFVILTGGIDLSMGGQVVLIGTTGMSLIMNNGLSIPMAILGMFAIGALIGALNGFNITMFSLPPFIGTLAMMNITRGLSLYLTKGKTIFGIPSAYGTIGLSSYLGLPISVWILAFFFILGFIILRYTTFGRRVYAVGSNPKSAWLSGINVRATIFWVYVINGIMAAMVSIVLTSKLLSAPGTMGQGLELDAIAAVVIGGTSLMGGDGNIAGSIIGALIIVVISNGLNLLGVSAFLQDVVKGMIILLAVVLDMWRKGYMFKESYVE